jgi:hypothetical protein
MIAVATAAIREAGGTSGATSIQRSSHKPAKMNGVAALTTGARLPRAGMNRTAGSAQASRSTAQASDRTA